jgi:hypothetical protein
MCKHLHPADIKGFVKEWESGVAGYISGKLPPRDPSSGRKSGNCILQGPKHGTGRLKMKKGSDRITAISTK